MVLYRLQMLHHYIVLMIMYSKLGRVGRNHSWPASRYCHSVCIEGL